MNTQAPVISQAASPNSMRNATTACARIVQIVARHRDVSPAAIYSPSRCRARIAAARQLAMYLCHVLLGLSMTQVGRCFNRDRTTVAHACVMMEDLRDDADHEREILTIEAAILDSVRPWDGSTQVQNAYEARI